jgi:hypothetical protein
MAWSDPFGQCRTGQIDALPGIDFTLPIQGKVIGVFGHECVRQQTGAGQATCDRTRARGRLDDRVAMRAGELRAHVANHPEARRNVFELLADILPQPLEGAATRRTAFGFGRMLDAFAGSMRGQGIPMGRRGGFACRRFGNGRKRRFGASAFHLFQRQFQLADHPGEAFRTTTEFHAPQLGNDELQVLDLGFSGGNFGFTSDKLVLLFKHQRLEYLKFIGQNRIHADTLHDWQPGEQPPQ